MVHANTSKHSGRASERYSGLWECYYDREHGEDVTGEGGEGVRGEGPANRLKNIRGFILKRRKSPLKGWHKVTQSRAKLKHEIVTQAWLNLGLKINVCVCVRGRVLELSDFLIAAVPMF